jgi:hypothetical protein
VPAPGVVERHASEVADTAAVGVPQPDPYAQDFPPLDAALMSEEAGEDVGPERSDGPERSASESDVEGSGEAGGDEGLSEHGGDAEVEDVWRFAEGEGEGLWAGRRYAVLRHARLGTAVELCTESDDFAFSFLTGDDSEIRAFLPDTAELAFVGRLGAPAAVDAARSAPEPLRAPGAPTCAAVGATPLRSIGAWWLEARGDGRGAAVALRHARRPGLALVLLPDGFLLYDDSGAGGNGSKGAPRALAVERGRLARLAGAAAPALLERKTQAGEPLLPFTAGGAGAGAGAALAEAADSEGAPFVGDLLAAGRAGVRGFDGDLAPFDAVAHPARPRTPRTSARTPCRAPRRRVIIAPLPPHEGDGRGAGRRAHAGVAHRGGGGGAARALSLLRPRRRALRRRGRRGARARGGRRVGSRGEHGGRPGRGS